MSIGSETFETDITIRLEATDGEVAEIDRTKNFGFVNTHSASSTWSCTVPGEYDLGELKWLLADVYIYFKDEFLFRGSKVSISGGGTGSEWDLEGEGVARFLKDGGPDQPVTIINERGATAIERYINDYTSFSAEVHEPPVKIIDQNRQVAAASSTSSWNDFIPEPEDDQPYRVSFGGLELVQTNFVLEGFDPDRTGDSMFRPDDDEYAEGQGMRFDEEGDYCEWDFSPSYEITEPALHVRSYGNGGPEVRLSLNGDDFGTTSTVRGYPLRWRRLANADEEGESGSLSSGQTHTIRAEAVSEPRTVDGYIDIDVVACEDQRFEHWNDDQWPNQVDSNGHLPGPWLYPEAYTVESNTIELDRNIAEASIDSVWAGGEVEGEQALSISNDGGDSWAQRSNSETLQTDFLEELGYPDRRNYGMDIVLRFTFGPRGNRTDDTPGQGYNSQRVTDLDVRVMTNSTEIVRNLTLDEDHLTNIQTVADDVDFRFTTPHEEYQRRVVAFQQGATAVERDSEWETRDWERSVDPGEYANRVVIRGARKDEGEETTDISGQERPQSVSSKDRPPRYRATEFDQDEIDTVGLVEFRPPANPDLTSRDLCVQKAREQLDERLAEPDVSGSVEIDPVLLTPGYAYLVEEFDGGDGYHSLEQIECSVGVGKFDMSLDFEGLGSGILGSIVGTRSDTSRLYRSV